MQKFMGGCLLGVGILIAGLSGLCILLVGGTTLVGGGSNEIATMIPAVLIVGGIPFAIGVGMFFLGRHLLRTAKADDGPDDPSVTFN